MLYYNRTLSNILLKWTLYSEDREVSSVLSNTGVGFSGVIKYNNNNLLKFTQTGFGRNKDHDSSFLPPWEYKIK